MTKIRKVFFNEKFVNEADAKVSIYDSSLMFGDMVFEMTRSYSVTRSLPISFSKSSGREYSCTIQPSRSGIFLFYL